MMQQQELVEYFFICGFDNSRKVICDPTDDCSGKCPLDRRYSPRVLAHYPAARDDVPFDSDAAKMLALPQGLLFRTAKQKLSPTFHSFVITREDGSRVYGYSYIFYERLEDPVACQTLHSLQHEYRMNRDSLTAARDSSPQKPTTSPTSNSCSSLPENISPACQSSSSSHQPHDTAVSDHQQLDKPSPDEQSPPDGFRAASDQQLYVCKCIGLLMLQPHLHLAKTFLPRLYRQVRVPCSPPAPLELHVGWLLHGLGRPSDGSCVRIDVLGTSCLLQRPSLAELPLLEHSLGRLCATLGIDKLLSLLTCLLLEYQIVILSRDYWRLMLVAESTSALLYPFQWLHVYVPVLPASMHHFLDAPVPFLMGLSTETRPTGCGGGGNVCMLDLDARVLELPEDLPEFPSRPELVNELADQLSKYSIYTQYLDSTSTSSLGGVHDPAVSRRQQRRGAPAAARGGGHGDSWSSLSECATAGSTAVQPEQYPGQNEGLKRITELVRNAGLDMHKLSAKAMCRRLNDQERYLEEQRCNNTVREILLNRFVHIFHTYEHFIVQPNQDMASWIEDRECTQSFDKVAFLSDQPRQDLPFLSRFIETQMFSAFVDRKVVSNWGELDPLLRLFDARIRRFKSESESVVRTPSYQRCSTLTETESLLDRRLACPDGGLPVLTAPGTPVSPHAEPRRSFVTASEFPLLDAALVDSVQSSIDCGVRTVSGQLRDLERFPSDTLQQLQTFSPLLTNTSLSAIRENNWKFVDHALKECKSRTKRLLVEKMGAEAAALGHGLSGIVGVEENTLIASMCDLLERIWCHGLQDKQGKSALWSHLRRYQERQSCEETSGSVDSTFRTDLCVSAETAAVPSSSLPAPRVGRPVHRHSNDQPPADVTTAVLRPLPASIDFDMRNVLLMNEIRTEIGYARAWIRLGLEKKLLSKHLRTLLSDDELLRGTYKRYAFLRSEEEREQFLCHLLSLNAVDYFSFSTSYPNTTVLYRVVIFTGQRPSAATTTANVWIRLSGSLAETGAIQLPRGVRHITFKHRNLGVLSTVQLGHDNTGMSPNWLVEQVVARNEVTCGATLFPCGRWLGRSIDDGSTERVLVGRPVDADELLRHTSALYSGDGSPQRRVERCRSPSVPRRHQHNQLSDAHALQQTLSDAVNAIVKYSHRAERERGSLALLMCGENGLATALHSIFSFGFKSSRLFGKNLYVWDYLERVQQQFESEFQGLGEGPPTERLPQVALCKLICEVNQANQAMGKDDRFQVWLLIAIRDRLLSGFVVQLSVCAVTQQMYEQLSFLRSAELLHPLSQLLASLHDYQLVLERSLTRGVRVTGRGRRSQSLDHRTRSVGRP